ncbi:hypothetical protein [Mastigocoleus sp. MO_188.B34]|uniref:hypothetical protein n=1 Tax=Mastigocoleus sp. MO_188.B34 TaxID=3036635 RepID=UPI00260DA590|nr:hypothetical protein [Mastigocoleus sp. MO_188.B34]MDJ0696790.1 hypothetical protein [Mastigocoleus sp. MO_188.B34]
MHIHRRQFVIGPEKFLLNETWKSYQLSNSVWLSYCPDLQVTTVKDNNGKAWYILGIVVETLQSKKSPAEEIKQTSSDRVPDLYSTWSGRWVLIGNGKLHLDASGLLGCFYHQNSQGGVWISSSVALLAQIVFKGRSPVIDSRQLQHEVGISWYTPPFSRFDGISQLLPSQLLDLDSGEIQSRPLMPEICLDRDYEDILDEIQKILVTTLQQLAKISPELWLGITAGYDSRLILALSHAAGIQVQPFTRIAARMSIADMIISQKVAKDCGYSHIFTRNSKYYPERGRLAQEHTGGHVSQGDAEPFVSGVRDNLKGISFGGHGFAVAKSFVPTLPKILPNAEVGASMIADLFQESKNSTATVGLKEWLNWVIDNPQNNLNWRDRFYLEQRQAGWLSSKEQLYDLNNFSRFPILNSAYLYSLFLSIKEEKRFASTIHIDLIDKIAPQLNQYPFNPPDSYFNSFQVFTSKIVKFKKKDLPKKIFNKSRNILHNSFFGLI